MIRRIGADKAILRVEAYHAKHPAAAVKAWYPDALRRIAEPEWQQLYVNAEYDSGVGVITISRESYNHDVDAELNRAIDWLLAAGVDRVILSSDFHLSTQMVGADTSEFFPALDDVRAGQELAERWTATARRLHSAFKVSVGVISGKRCLGGMLELVTHCHYVLAVNGAQLGMPEVTLPVVPGMEGCHWTFRKAQRHDWPKLVQLLLSGRPVKAEDAVGWLTDFSGPIDGVLSTAWALASDAGKAPVARRALDERTLEAIPADVAGLPVSGSPATDAARKAILDCVRASCGTTLANALSVQARHSAEFMKTSACRKGRIGGEYDRTMAV
jgi:enoyl-CoA hydratase/carnithine racemase